MEHEQFCNCNCHCAFQTTSTAALYTFVGSNTTGMLCSPTHDRRIWHDVSSCLALFFLVSKSGLYCHLYWRTSVCHNYDVCISWRYTAAAHDSDKAPLTKAVLIFHVCMMTCYFNRIGCKAAGRTILIVQPHIANEWHVPFHAVCTTMFLLSVSMPLRVRTRIAEQ